jgi:hypothetical protein
MKQKKVMLIADWLNESPQENEVFTAPSGGLHIPIEILRPLLDKVNYCTRNYTWSLYKDGYANLCVAASIELDISYLNNESVYINKTFVGACNFSLPSILPNTDWNATAKSMCIKNASIEAAKRFGRELNIESIPNKSNEVIAKEKPKSKPDIKILKQFEEAVLRGDQATITMLTNIYDIKIKEDEAKNN